MLSKMTDKKATANGTKTNGFEKEKSVPWEVLLSQNVNHVSGRNVIHVFERNVIHVFGIKGYNSCRICASFWAPGCTHGKQNKKQIEKHIRTRTNTNTPPQGPARDFPPPRRTWPTMSLDLRTSEFSVHFSVHFDFERR